MSELKHQLMLNKERSWVPSYLKSEADKVIKRLENAVDVYKSSAEFFKGKFAETSMKLCESQKTCKALRRALWLARASEASKEVNYWTCQDESSYAIVDFNVKHETIVSYKAPHHRPYKWILIWENVERKCLKKADEYK